MLRVNDYLLHKPCAGFRPGGKCFLSKCGFRNIFGFVQRICFGFP